MPTAEISEVPSPRKMIVSQPAFRWSSILAGLILAFIIIPSFQVIFGYHLFRYILPLFFLWVMLVSVESPLSWGFVKYKIFELWIYGYWCAVVFLYALMSPNSGYVINEYLGNIITLFYIMFQITVCYIMGLVYINEADQKNYRSLVRFFFIAIGVNALIALPSLFDQQLAVREYINSYQSFAATGGPQLSISTFALGGLGLYTLEALFTPYFLAILIGTKGFVRMIYIALFIAIAINIFMSSLLLVQLLFMLSVVIFLFLKILKSDTSISVRLGFVSLTLLLAFLAIQVSNSQAMQYSTNRVIKYLNPNNTYNVRGDTLEERMMEYSDSINTFIAHPILGIGFAAYIGKPIQGQRLGGHSGIFDGFGMYGLLFSIYIIFLWIKYNHLRKLRTSKKEDTWVLSGMICFLTYMILILLNPFIFDASVSGIFFFGVIASAVPDTH